MASIFSVQKFWDMYSSYQKDFKKMAEKSACTIL
jgi:hypothetical protein